MKVFVTGGTGLIGRSLVPHLLARGDQVVCLTRNPEAVSILPDGARLVAGDPAVPGDWMQMVAEVDAVVNLAGESVGKGLWTGGKRRRIRRSRLNTTDNLVQGLQRGDGAAVLVSASATGIYGDRGNEALGEDSQPGRGFLARLAVEWENTAREAESERVRVALLRIGVVLASDGGVLANLLPLFRRGLGGPLGGGRQYFPWIHIRDLVRAVLFCLDEPKMGGPVNAAVPNAPTQKEFAAALGAAIGKPARVPTPAFVLRNLLGPKSELVLAGQRAVPNVLKAHGFRFEFTELESALADLLGA